MGCQYKQKPPATLRINGSQIHRLMESRVCVCMRTHAHAYLLDVKNKRALPSRFILLPSQKMQVQGDEVSLALTECLAWRTGTWSIQKKFKPRASFCVGSACPHLLFSLEQCGHTPIQSNVPISLGLFGETNFFPQLQKYSLFSTEKLSNM